MSRTEYCVFYVLMLIMTMMTTIVFAAAQTPVPTDADGEEHAEFLWCDQWGVHYMSLDIPVSDIEGCRQSIVPRMHCPLSIDRFIIDDDATITAIADKFNKIMSGKSDTDKVSFVGRFISKCISYHDDMSVHGNFEYFQYPVETLLMRSGDCEDMAILCTSILRAMGFDSILLVGNEHCMTGVNIESDGRYSEMFGTRYYHLDPSSGCPVGESDCNMIPWFPIYRDIAFVVVAVAMILCLMAFSDMIWRD